MTGTVSHTVTWAWLDGGIDRLRVEAGDGGVLWQGHHGETQYWLWLSPDAQTRWVKVAHHRGGGAVKRLHLIRQGGMWRDPSGKPLPGSQAAIDVDIGCTASTNTLPVRRLGLGIGELRDIDVLYVPVPGLDPKIVRQRYARHRGGYDYTNLDSGFSARLAVDAAGWVTDYPGVCQRQEAGQ